MCPPLLLLLFLPLFSADELISVRCQTKCLHNLEMKNEGNVDVRRSMKHQVVSVCAADLNCSACTTACSEPFDDLPSCTSSFCTKYEGDASTACIDSCLFLQNIYTEKPGSCPSFPSPSSLFECAASCHLDGDCGETEKCCSVGCSRMCVQPEKGSTSLLPIPSQITVTERKRRRSAILRWTVKKMSKKQSNSVSNLFVIQWRWGLKEESMGAWQTILIKNKMYAIVKHLLSPGRLYQFRVASVSIDGSLGFSTPSIPFKLSKEPKTPSPPTVILGSSRLTPSGLWSLTMQWTVPTSDLPIKNYEVSWEESTTEEANSFQGRSMAALTRNIEEEEEDSPVDGLSLGGFGGKTLRKSTVVPSHHTNIVIEGLSPNTVYLIEVHATVDSSEGEIHGEKGIIFIPTSSLSPSEQSNDTPTESTGYMHIETPHFERSKLVTGVNWIDTNICTRRGSYVLRVKRERCGGTKEDNEWEDRLLSSCSTTVDGLLFECDYTVQLYAQNERDQMLSSSFSTLDCNSTRSSSSLSACHSSPLFCSVQSFVVICHWPHTHNPLESTIGYRVSLISDDSKSSQISIVPPQTPETTFQNLRSGVQYSVEVQSITSRGMGTSMITRFTAPIDEDDEKENEEQSIIEGGEIIELPLLNISSSQSLTTIYFILFMFILL